MNMQISAPAAASQPSSIKHKASGAHVQNSRYNSSSRSAVASPPRAAAAATVSFQQYDDFELLWMQYGRQLSLSKSAIFWCLQDVQRGVLPCDAEELRSRASGFAALGQRKQVPGLDALRVLNSSRHALHHEPGHVQHVLQQLLQLLPGSPPTQLLLDVLADLDLPPEILALQHQEVNAAFRAVLGAGAPAAALHHILQRWRQQHQPQHAHQSPAGTRHGAQAPNRKGLQQQQQQQQVHEPGGSQGTTASQQQRLWAAAGRGPASQPAVEQQQQAIHGAAAAEAAVVEPQALEQQLTMLRQLLGPEAAHAALGKCPGLLELEPSRLCANLQWLQQQLQVSPVAAVLMAEAAGDVLLLPRGILGVRYSNMCYILLQLLGWRLQQAHKLLCNAPQLLACESAQLASNWQQVQQASRRRAAWLEELAGASQGLAGTVLGAQPHQLQQLRYAAEARELQGQSLLQVLRKEYVDFVYTCPGFRVWRGLVPAAEKQPRWSLVDSGCIVVHAQSAAGGPTSLQSAGKVLAADTRGQPVLIQLRELGPGDRLVGCGGC